MAIRVWHSESTSAHKVMVINRFTQLNHCFFFFFLNDMYVRARAFALVKSRTKCAFTEFVKGGNYRSNVLLLVLLLFLSLPLAQLYGNVYCDGFLLNDAWNHISFYIYFAQTNVMCIDICSAHWGNVFALFFGRCSMLIHVFDKSSFYCAFPCERQKSHDAKMHVCNNSNSNNRPKRPRMHFWILFRFQFHVCRLAGSRKTNQEEME